MAEADLRSLRRTTVGFDRIADLARRLDRTRRGDDYPPYDLQKLDGHRYRIVMAVAGFRPDELSVSVDGDVLTIAGTADRAAEADRPQLHRGIARRNFRRRFHLADFIEVRRAALADGLLTVDLRREPPRASRTVEIETPGRAQAGAVAAPPRRIWRKAA